MRPRIDGLGTPFKLRHYLDTSGHRRDRAHRKVVYVVPVLGINPVKARIRKKKNACLYFYLMRGAFFQNENIALRRAGILPTNTDLLRRWIRYSLHQEIKRYIFFYPRQLRMA